MRTLLLCGVAMMAACGTAAAVPITATYDFTATFASGPNPVILGTTSLSYSTNTRAGGIPVDGFTSPQLGAYGPFRLNETFVGNTFPTYTGTLTVSDSPYTNDILLVPGSNTFALTFNVDFFGNVVGSGSLQYTATGTPGIFAATRVDVTREAAAVPEPATLALLALPIGLMALVPRRRAGGERVG